MRHEDGTGRVGHKRRVGIETWKLARDGGTETERESGIASDMGMVGKEQRENKAQGLA